jgi:hypothetical protein
MVETWRSSAPKQDDLPSPAASPRAGLVAVGVITPPERQYQLAAPPLVQKRGNVRGGE